MKFKLKLILFINFWIFGYFTNISVDSPKLRDKKKLVDLPLKKGVENLIST